MSDVVAAHDEVQISFLLFNLLWLLLRSQWGSGGVMPRLSWGAPLLRAGAMDR